jgi:hypothetical protein
MIDTAWLSDLDGSTSSKIAGLTPISALFLDGRGFGVARIVVFIVLSLA